MKQLLLAAIVLPIVLTSACRKRSTPPGANTNPAESPAAPAQTAAPGATSPAPSSAPPQPTSAPRQPAGAPGADRVDDRIPSAPPHSSKTNPVDRALTEALQRYNEANGKMPDSFQVLVTEKYLKALPTPPAGKHYAIDRPHMQVVLINQ